MERARELLAQGRPRDAADLLAETLHSLELNGSGSDSGQRAQLLLARGEAHLQCRAAATARRDADAALRCNPCLARAWLLKAAALQVEGDSLRAEAHAACALQLEPKLRADPLCEPWVGGCSWVFLEAREEEGGGGGILRLDQLVYGPARPPVIVLGPGTHYTSGMELMQHTAIIGLGGSQEVKLTHVQRMYGSPDTVGCQGPGTNASTATATPASIIFENLHIANDSSHALLVCSGHVAAHSCTFSRSGGGTKPAVSAVGGCLRLVDCTVERNEGAGGFMAAESGTLSLLRCTAHNCAMNGIEACFGGSLQAEDCSSYSNSQGCLVRCNAGAVQLTQCCFYNNTREGVMVSASKQSPLLLRSCQIYSNGTYGLALDRGDSQKGGSAAQAVDCRIHSNSFWGIIVKSVSDLELTGCEMFGNKCGGVYLGLNGEGVVKLTSNHIHHNFGAGFWDTTRDERISDRMRSMVQDPKFRAVAAAQNMQTHTRKPELRGNQIENNEQRHGHPPKLPDSEKRCSMCQAVQSSEQKLLLCSACRLERYCGAACQRAAWRAHRPICRLTTAGNEVVVDLHPLSAKWPEGGYVAGMAPHPLLKVKRNARTPEQKGGSIIVKIQDTENDPSPTQWLVVYDTSRTLNACIKSEALHRLLREKGVLGTNGFTSKKIYAHAQVEEGGSKLRVLTHQLAPLQSW